MARFPEISTCVSRLTTRVLIIYRKTKCGSRSGETYEKTNTGKKEYNFFNGNHG
jgi:hypothetical protein